ncbi:MAG TPA: hypothetical protein VKT81_08500 [Bryobacteraceae bacterium]|nr:hypothetical protein [Bryobacteraceae bacterium]
MRRRAIHLCLLAASVISAQTGDGFAFRVQVVNSVTGAPIPSASIVLEKLDIPSTFGTSDSSGVFAGHVPSAGKYLLVAKRHGYQIAGNMPMGVTFDIEPSAENSAVVKMLPLGVITGRVVDQYGDPLRHALVHGLRKRSLPELGEYFEGFNSGETDDRGEYRIAGLEPGSYYVAAEYGRDMLRIGGSVRWPEIGGIVIFPDASDIAGGQQVEVIAGSTTRMNDLRLKLHRSVTIRGHVKPAPARGDLSLSRAGAHLGLNAFAIQGGMSEPDGSFSFEVLPGRYLLRASDGKSGKMSKEITIEVRDKDVDGIELSLDASYEINGRIIAEGADSAESLDYSKIMLHFLGMPVKFSSDGTFHATASPTAIYFLQQIPPDWYLKEVTVGGRTLSGKRFDLEPGTTDVVFHLRPDGGSVEFTSPSKERQFMVLLLPENGPPIDLESMLHGMPDPASGKFVVHSVPPGSYRAFALDETNLLYLYNPQMLLDKYKSAGTPITVAPREHKSVVVPAAKIPE